jgi:hypothetical protein
MRPLVAQTLLGLGRRYQRTGRRAAAADRLADAVLLLHEMGMRPWLSIAAADELQAIGDLFIVARSKRALYDDLQRELGDRPIRIILDRRDGERRHETHPLPVERRVSDRRRQAAVDEAVRTRGFVVVVGSGPANSA